MRPQPDVPTRAPGADAIRSATAGSRRLSLRAALLALVVAMGVPLLGLSSWLLWTAHLGERERVATLLRDQTRSMARQVDAEFARAEVLLGTLAASRSLGELGTLAAFENDAQAAARRLGSAQRGRIEIEILDGDGNPLGRVGGRESAASVAAALAGAQAAGPTLAPAARRALASQRVEWSDYAVDPATGRRSIVGYLALAESQAPVRLLAAVLPDESLSAILHAQQWSDGRVAAILDGAGILVARSFREAELVGRPATATVRARLGEHDEGIIDPLVNQDGAVSVVAYSRAPASRYAVVIAAPHEALLQPLRSALVRNLAIGALVVLVALVAAYAIARRLIGALERVARGAPPTGLRETDVLATRLAAAARERDAALVALRDADRRKDEFLAMLSHELRNPLAPLTNVLRLLDRGPPRTGHERQALDIARRQTAQLSRLVEDLLEVSRITHGRIELRLQPLQVCAAVRRAAEALEPDATRRGHRLELDLPDAPVWIDADPVRFEQIVLNLLGNAFKYTPDGGRVVARVRRVGTQVELRVVDNGIGLDAGELPGLFQPFHQAATSLDRAAGGLGVGLALVKRLAELHGGTVGVESRGHGHGSTFIVTLPLAAAAAEG